MFTSNIIQLYQLVHRHSQKATHINNSQPNQTITWYKKQQQQNQTAAGCVGLAADYKKNKMFSVYVHKVFETNDPF